MIRRNATSKKRFSDSLIKSNRIGKFLRSFKNSVGIIATILMLFSAVVHLFYPEFKMPNNLTPDLWYILALIILASGYYKIFVGQSLDEENINGSISSGKVKNHDKVLSKQLKSLPPYSFIGTYKTNNLEWDVLVAYEFEVTAKPQSREFSSSVRISDKPRCEKCSADLISRYDDYNRSNMEMCPNNKNHVFLYRHQIDALRKAGKNIVKGLAITDFDKYWSKYIDEYNNVTKGKPDEYKTPKRKVKPYLKL